MLCRIQPLASRVSHLINHSANLFKTLIHSGLKQVTCIYQVLVCIIWKLTACGNTSSSGCSGGVLFWISFNSRGYFTSLLRGKSRKFHRSSFLLKDDSWHSRKKCSTRLSCFFWSSRAFAPTWLQQYVMYASRQGNYEREQRAYNTSVVLMKLCGWTWMCVNHNTGKILKNEIKIKNKNGLLLCRLSNVKLTQSIIVGPTSCTVFSAPRRPSRRAKSSERTGK